MKFIVAVFFAAVISVAVYLLNKKNKKAAVILTVFTALVLSSFIGFAMFKSATAPDTWCSQMHATTSYPPVNLVSAMDYFEQGNYDYDRGDCKKAVEDYTKSISLNSKYPQSLNNRAYAYMRMQNYKDALTDLNKAISLKPDYIQALMNRGDIYNFYLKDKEKAIADYEKIISLVGPRGTSACGRLFLAKHDGWNLGTLLGFPTEVINCRGGI